MNIQEGRYYLTKNGDVLYAIKDISTMYVGCNCIVMLEVASSIEYAIRVLKGKASSWGVVRNYTIKGKYDMLLKSGFDVERELKVTYFKNGNIKGLE